MIKSGLTRYQTDDVIFLWWVITRNCNFNCDYCNSGRDDDFCQTPIIDASQKTIEKTIERINFLESIKPVELLITGGEPTIKDLEYIFKNLKLDRSISVFTNLSQSIEYFEHLNKIHPITILASYHQSEMSLFEYTSKINKLFLKNIDTICKIMIKDDNDFVIKEHINKNVKIEFFNILPNPSKELQDNIVKHNTNKPYFYKDTSKNIDIQCSLYEMICYHNNYFLYKCSAHSNGLCIDFNGKVYTCKTHFQQNKSLSFTIFDDFEVEYLKYIKKQTICPLKRCVSDLGIIKECKYGSAICRAMQTGK